VPESEQKKERAGIGFLGWLILLSLAFVGGWVVVGNAIDWAKPWWRYASIASISFTVGTFYGRFRRDEKKRSREH
jgi:hypothetical protein